MTESITPSPIQEPVSVDDNGSSLTVDGTVAVTEPVSVDDNAGSLTVDNTTLAVVGGGTEAAAMRVTLANDSTGLVSVDDNGGSLTVDGTVSVTEPVSVDDNGGSLTVDGTVTVGDGTNNVVVQAAGADNLSNADNELTTAALAYAFDGTAWDRVPNGGGTEAAAMRVTLANDSTGLVSVDDNGGALTVDQATASSLNAQVVGSVAHDTGSPGNPVVMAGSAQDQDDTAPPNRVSAESDVTRLATDRDGSLHVHTYGPQIWSYHSNGSTALTDASVHAAPGAGLSLYVTDIVFSSGAATAINAFFEEGSTTVLGPYYLEATAGRGMSIHFQTPKKITANTALTVTTSAAIAHSVDVTGFVAQG